MFTFLIVRYSVYNPANDQSDTPRAVRSSRTKEGLFSAERMSMRAWLFEHVVLNSLARQKPALDADKVRMLLLTSDQLPADDRVRLDQMAAPYPWIQIIPIQDADHMRPALLEAIRSTLSQRYPGQARVPYATLRLDDDDAVSHDFLARVQRHVAPPFVGMCVSLGRGYSGWVDTTGQYTQFRELVFPNIAIGLAYIGAYDVGGDRFLARYHTIFSLGRHTAVHLKAPTILHCRRPSYVRTLYAGQDSSSENKQLYRTGEEIAPEIVMRRVPVHPKMLRNFPAALAMTEVAAEPHGLEAPGAAPAIAPQSGSPASPTKPA